MKLIKQEKATSFVVTIACDSEAEASRLEAFVSGDAPAAVETTFDFNDGNGPVQAHKHPNGGGWVADTARVAVTAYVGPDARVYGSARVFRKVRIDGTARIYGSARVYGRAWIGGSAEVDGTARIYGSAWVYGRARVGGLARVFEGEIFEGEVTE